MKKTLFRTLVWIAYLAIGIGAAMGQHKATIAVVSIDTRGLEMTNETMASLVRLELEKNDHFEVMDRYDVSDAITAHSIDPENSFGKNAVVRVGKLLNTEKMLTGSVERFGDKIVMIFRLVDVESERIEQTSVMEYLNIQEEIQSMVLISLNELLEIENDPYLVDLLIDYDLPITSTKTTVNLSGPRMGATLFLGDAGQRLQDSKDIGGYDMFPVSSMFGYQFEQKYLSSGDFQALIEVIPAITGLESGSIIPSVSFLNGFRFNDSGWEMGLGPIVRFTRMAEWSRNGSGRYTRGSEGSEVKEIIDSSGNIKASVGLVIAAGKTFHSGYLNVPVNLFITPRKNGTSVGLTFGFNTTNKPKI
jgi:TolB-like protein